MSHAGRALGARGEQIAAEFLSKMGMRLLARNARTRLGELDLVMDDRGTIVVVEVKTRLSHARIGPTEAITAAKSGRLVRLGEQYLVEAERPDARWRIDVVSVLLHRSGQLQQVEHIRDAVTGQAQGLI